MEKVAIYIRWSTEDQGEGTTLDVQVEACRAYIASQGWTHQEDLIYVDDGVSGATMERPALTRLRAAVAQGLVACVVVYKLDRLSRSVLDMLKLVLEEWQDRCHVKSAREPIDTLTPTGKMFFYQLMSFAEWERSVIRDRMHAGRVRRAQQGRSPGATLPFGYRRGAAGQPELEENAAAVVRRIFKLYLSGLGCRAIAQQLDREGHPGPAGGPWAQPSVGRILRNPAYTGQLVYGRTRVKGGKKVAAEEPLVVRDGYYPALISPEAFAAVQSLRQERPAVGRGQGTGRSLGSQSLLSGLLRCICGRACSAIALETRGMRYRYYTCSGAQNSGAHLCGAGNIRQDVLDQAVREQVLTFFQAERVAGHLSRDLRERHQELMAAKEAAGRELRRLQESERRLRGLLIDGKLAVEEYRALATDLAGRLAQAERQALEAEAAEGGAQGARERQAGLCRLLERIDQWEALALLERKQLLRQFVKQVTAYRDKRTGEVTCDIAWAVEPA